MKKILISTLLLFCNLIYSQKNCEFETNVTDSIGTYKSTPDYIVQERIFGNEYNSIFLSLINADGLASLKVQTIQRSQDFIPAKCFNKNSKVYFQLSSGKIVTLIPVEQDDCGISVRNGNENSRVLTGYFLFIKDSFEDLKNSPITFMRIKYGIDTIDYIFKNELVSEIDKKTYYPENYFINYLKCIE